MRAEEIIDEDDWVEVEKAAPAAKSVLSEVSVKITISAIARSKTLKPRAYLAFRGKAAEWIVANGPRFRIAIGGANANHLRIVPDAAGGKFEFFNAIGGQTKRMNLGSVSAWPGEERASTAAHWDISPGYMKLRLPDDFAVARSAAPAPKAAAAAPVVAARSPNVVAIIGEPAHGRSALAKRR